MTQNELNECMNLYMTLWKSSIISSDHRDAVMKTWIDRGFLKLDYDLFKKALYEYEDTAEKPYIAPRFRQIIDAYNNVKTRNTKGTRRIVTMDEVMYGYYLEEMKKPPEKRDEFKIRRCLDSAKIMNDPELYKKKHGAYREQFERY